MNFTVKDTLPTVINAFEANRNEQNAIGMKNYMKGHFEFLGIKTPERRVLARSIYKKVGKLPKEQMFDFIKELWDLPEREYQYFALDYLVKQIKLLEDEDVSFLEFLISTKSWWDTVDTIASKCVGELFSNHQTLVAEYSEGWAISENMWLRRTAILFQLKYKDKTDHELLFRIIEKNTQDNEFFIRKGIGWALREYSKTNPEAVAEFIDTHYLSNLSKREGQKYL